jgi:glycosyltransferase involved in cell wall biosynthesis
MPEVSFVIIALNEELGIQKCIESIVNQKTSLSYEVILIDDGSTDATVEIVMHEFGDSVQIKSQPNLGRGQSRFNGIQIAKAPIIAFVDGDIILPENWLQTCYENLTDFVGVGGIAVPDGDCSTIHRLLSLQAKAKPGSISLTGNNTVIRKTALLEIESDWQTRLGEDFRLNQLLSKKGYRVSNIPNLLVQHNEHKSYLASLRWLMNSGADATRLVFQFKKIRTPDLAFAIWFIALIYLMGSLLNQNLPLGLPVFFIITATISTFHLYSKFEVFKTPLRSLLGVFLNFPLITSYLFGRLFGLFAMVFKKRKT